jgi:transposase
MNPESPSEPTREELNALIKAQAAEIAALKARVAELERRLGLNSSNSGKPPSLRGGVRGAMLGQRGQRRDLNGFGRKEGAGATGIFCKLLQSGFGGVIEAD